MPKFVNESKTTPMSVRYGGNTYIVPPGETLTFDEPEKKDTPIPDSPAPVKEKAPQESVKETTSPQKKGRGRKKEATK